MSTNNYKFRILCLDGGGIRGIYTASFLAQIEEMTQKRIIEYFDLIVGTSTGGIISMGLGAGLSASTILKFYREQGPYIFPPQEKLSKFWVHVKHAFKPKHSSEALKSALIGIFGEKRLGESQTRLVIPTYNVHVCNIRLLKTCHHERLKMDYLLPMVDVAMATASAPTFFPAYEFDDGLTCIDGGIWANCPVMVGITEAIAVLGRAVEDIYVLSIGTTQSAMYLDEKKRVGGALRWTNPLSETSLPFVLMQAQEKGALAQAQVLIRNRLLRINAYTRHPYKLDDTTKIADLIQYGMEDARHQEEKISQIFLDIEKQPFKPCYVL